jgi:hypothetical protein
MPGRGFWLLPKKKSCSSRSLEALSQIKPNSAYRTDALARGHGPHLLRPQGRRVAMWQPMEVFLYVWWTIRAGVWLFDRLTAMLVRINRGARRI